MYVHSGNYYDGGKFRQEEKGGSQLKRWKSIQTRDANDESYEMI